jgi:hypothetical protein
MTDSAEIENPSVRTTSTENVSNVAAPVVSATHVSSDPSAKSQTEVTEELHSRSSTGPRTVEGKRRAKHNAIKHGLFADIVLTGEPFRESRENYFRLLESLREDIQPVGALEEVLVDQLAFEFLRLGRLYRADVQVAPLVFKQLEADLKKDAPSLFNPADEVGETIVIRRELSSELLLRYGNAVSNQIHRTLDRLERLQRTRRGQPVAPRIDVNLS